MEWTMKHTLKGITFAEILPQRVIVSIFGFFAIVNAYTMRYCLDIALTEIIRSSVNTVQTLESSEFPESSELPNNTSLLLRIKSIVRRRRRSRINTNNSALSSTQQQSEVVASLNNWSDQLQMIITISFYFGYVITHVPGGILAERYGGKWVLGTGIATAAIFTILTPFAIKIGGPIALICIRFIIGLCEGPTYPALGTLLSQWVPPKERGTLGVLALSGGQAAMFLVNFASTVLLQNFEWPLVFHFFGGCSLIWFIIFINCCYNDAESNPFINQMEKKFLQQEINIQRSNAQLTDRPWKDIFTSIPVLALISATIQYDWTQVQMVSEMRKFIKEVKEISYAESLSISFSASTPYLLNWIISLISGIISDILISQNIFTTTIVRKIMTSIVGIGPNLFMSLASCVACNESKSIRNLLNCAIGVMGTYYAGIVLTPLDMSPNYAGTLMGIANGMGSLTSIVAPLMKNIKFNHLRFNEIRAVLWLACTVFISGDIQEFNDPVLS